MKRGLFRTGAAIALAATAVAPRAIANKLVLANGERYIVKRTAIDFAGNEAQAPGAPLEVVAPSLQVAKPR